LVARGELPMICLGRRRLVPKVGLLALVGHTAGGDAPMRAPLAPRLPAMHPSDTHSPDHPSGDVASPGASG
jgi:hypothetical protein